MDNHQIGIVLGAACVVGAYVVMWVADRRKANGRD